LVNRYVNVFHVQFQFRLFLYLNHAVFGFDLVNRYVNVFHVQFQFRLFSP